MLTNIIKVWPLLFLGLTACQFSAPSGGSPSSLPQPTSTPTWSEPTPRPTLPPLPDIPDLPAGTLVKCERKTDWQTPYSITVSKNGQTAYVFDIRSKDSDDYWSEQNCASREYNINPIPTPLASANVIRCERKLPSPTMEKTIYKITPGGLSLWQNKQGQCFQDISFGLQKDNTDHLYVILKHNQLFKISTDYTRIEQKSDLSPAFAEFNAVTNGSAGGNLHSLYVDSQNNIFFSLAFFQINGTALSRFYKVDTNGIPKQIEPQKQIFFHKTAYVAHDPIRQILYTYGIHPVFSIPETAAIWLKEDVLKQAGLPIDNSTRIGLGPSRVLKDGRVVTLSHSEHNALFLIDHKNQIIVRLAGSEKYGYRDGLGTEALFSNPIDLDLDEAENIYVLDAGNKAIRKVTLAGQVTTFYRQNP
jgi:hypothetical protein